MTARISMGLRRASGSVLALVVAACAPAVDNTGPLSTARAGTPAEVSVPVTVTPVEPTAAGAVGQMTPPMAASGSVAIDPPVDAGTQVDAALPSKRAYLVPDAAQCVIGCSPVTSPLAQTLEEAVAAPPPLGGSGMLVSKDGKQLIVADADRDRLYFVDVETHALAHVRELQAGDQPGRMVEDAAGRIHVALRGGGALLSLGRAPDAPLTRRTLCAQPRGLAYDAARDVLQLACAEGKLVTAPADPGGAATRTLELERDLRDVIVREDGLLVTRFRSAELLRLDASGAVKDRLLPPKAEITGQRDPQSNQMLPPSTNTPDMVWRALDLPGQGVALLHQRARDGQVNVTPGGYGSVSCAGLVQAALTLGLDGPRTLSTDLADSTLSIDMAVDPSGMLLAVISPGNWGNTDQLRVYSLTGASALNVQSPPDLATSSLAAPTDVFATGTSTQRCLAPATRFPSPDGQLAGVAWVNSSYGLELVAFEREPAAINFIQVRTRLAVARLDLRQASRYDTGHAVFHMRTRAGLACASCHGEAGDDGHVWTFQGLGARRTQSLRGGIAGTEPLHWGGDMKDFGTLVNDVFVGRMQGPLLTVEQSNVLYRYIDRQPKLTAPVRDMAQAERGRALFQSTAVGCASCHAGKLLTDNRSVDVGTGEVLQVPALRNVSYRLPLMHNGCATSLRQRFDAACGGGDKHGNTSQLTPAELDDLIAYLETL